MPLSLVSESSLLTSDAFVSELKTCRQENSELRSQLQHYSETNQKLEDKLSKAQALASSLEGEVRILAEEKEAFHHVQVFKELVKNIENNNQAAQDVNKLEDEVKEYKDKLDKLSADLQSERSKSAELEVDQATQKARFCGDQEDATRMKAELESVKREKAQLLKEMKVHAELLREMDKVVQAGNMVLEEKDDYLEVKDEVMLDMEKVNHDKNRAVQEKNVAIEEMEKAIVEKNVAIEGMETAIVEKNVAIEGMEKAIVEKNVAIEEMETAIVEKNVAIEGMEKAIVEKNEAIEEKIKVAHQLSALRSDFLAKESVLQIHQERLEAKQGEKAETLKTTDKDAEATIVVLQEKVEQLESSNKQLQGRLEVLDVENVKHKESISNQAAAERSSTNQAAAERSITNQAAAERSISNQTAVDNKASATADYFTQDNQPKEMSDSFFLEGATAAISRTDIHKTGLFTTVAPAAKASTVHKSRKNSEKSSKGRKGSALNQSNVPAALKNTKPATTFKSKVTRKVDVERAVTQDRSGAAKLGPGSSSTGPRLTTAAAVGSRLATVKRKPVSPRTAASKGCH